MAEGLISVIIPTRNSSATLESCIKSIKNQTYQPIEIIIVDSKSSDSTKHISKMNGAKFVEVEWKLLGARLLGLRETSGNHILMLDSDQILNADAIENCMKMMDEFDMLCLEEHTHNPQTFIQRAFEADRRLIHAHQEIQLDPLYGTLLARFYKRQILEKAFDAIPTDILPFVVAHDHAIIYYEAYKMSHKVGLVKNALWHQEPKTVGELWSKNVRYGRSTRELAKSGYYSELISKKTRFRKSSGMSMDKLLSSLLLLLKAPAYLKGYYSR